MPTTATIPHAFFATLERQRLLHGRPLTSFDRAIGNVILRASMLAMDDVQQHRTDRNFKVVSAPTGSGKSTSAVALAAALYDLDPQFSAAFIVDTGRQCDEVYQLLKELLTDSDDVVVWSTYHDIRSNPSKVEQEQGFRPSAQFHPNDMKSARIVVCTHAKWKGEMTKNNDAGVRQWRGRPRSLMFVDEHPSLVKLIEKRPSDVLALRDAIYSRQPDHPWVPVLETITSRMDIAFKASGAAYVAVELVTPEEGRQFRETTAFELTEFTAGQRDDRAERAAVYEETARFISSAADGCVFLSRNNPSSFVSYELEFRPGPGYVLLDATADLTNMAVLMPGMEDVEVPAVDFSNLEITHVKGPKNFGNIRDTVSTAVTARPYAEWIVRCVLDNTKPGDQVLVVGHQALFDHDYISKAEDPRNPADWSGRKVSTLHWGAGIGSNRYKHASHVFLFGEFFIPKKVVIGNVLGYRRQRASEADLTGAVAATMSGLYLGVTEGHLLRWAKQLSCRGNVRNIDGDGKCGRMKLFTSMDFSRLTRHLSLLFPGAAPPRVKSYRDDDASDMRPTERLVELLSSTDLTVITSDEVERLTSVCSRNIKNYLRSHTVAAVVNLYGWTLVSASEIGRAGKRKCFVRCSSLPPHDRG